MRKKFRNPLKLEDNKVNFDRIQWAMSTSIMKANDGVANGDSKMSLCDKINFGIDEFENDSGQKYDTGIWYIGKVERIARSGTEDTYTEIDSGSSEHEKLFKPVDRKVESTRLRLKECDQFDYSEYTLSIPSEDLELDFDFGNGYSCIGACKIPDDVLFFYKNYPYIQDNIRPVNGVDHFSFELDYDNYADILIDMKITVYCVLIEWNEDAVGEEGHAILTECTFKYYKINESSVGCTLSLESEKEASIDCDKAKALEREKIIETFLSDYDSMFEGRNDEFELSL